MANNIVLKTYRGGSVTPLDDAIIQQTVIATNGIFKGCNVTYARGNVLHVSQGFGMIKGRFFEVYDCEVGVILNSGSGTLQGRLYIHMDLSNADEPIQLLTETASVLTDLTGDEDVNYNNTSYDLELATFGVTRTGITNLEQTFEKITGASGSGGASTLQRSTEYFKGDFVTCKNAPGWVTLYCTTAGVTAAAEPVEYAGIAEVGDRVTDGTCVFTARDVVGEIDVLKDLFTDTETSIAGLEDGLQELREEVIKQAESKTVPVGTIQFMPSANAGADWLKCDGSFVNEADYPELVQALGKLMPSGDKFTLLSSGEIPSQISNGAVYNGRLWVYSFSARKLYGIDLEGNGPIKAIPVTSTSTYFADFIAPSPAKPIVLSIVPHHSGNTAKLFLSQFLASGGTSTMTAEYYWTSYFLVFSAEFSGEEDTLEVEQPFSTIKKETGLNTYYYYPIFDPSFYVPYVVSKMVAGVETYYCAIGTRGYTYGGSSAQGALSWSEDSKVASLIPITIYTDTSVFKNQRTAYSERSNGEIVSVTATLSSSRTYSIYSFPAGLFEVNSKSYSGTITARGSVCPLNVAGESKLLATFDVNSFPWASITETKVGSIKPDLPLPSSAKVFVDAAAYLWGKGIFLVFVGTGIIFSRTLEAGSFGYLDTTSVLGTITQFGWLGYSQDEQSLYILGQDTSNRVKLAKITLNTNFDYATDGAWLPMIVSDGLPAYIKAKETETA